MAKLISSDTSILNQGELCFVNSAVEFLPDEYIIYHHREINGRESDCIILIPDVGILVVEIKGWKDFGNISVEHGDSVRIETSDRVVFENPKRQARAYRFDIYNYISKKTGLTPLVFDMVAYPHLDCNSYEKLSLDLISGPEFTFTKDDILSANSFMDKIHNAYSIAQKWGKCTGIDSADLETIRSLFEPNFVKHSLSYEKSDYKKNILTESEKELEPAITQIPLSGLYSVLMTVDETISDDEIEEIFANYINGTSYYLFVKKDAVFEKLRYLYLQKFDEMKSLILSGNTEVEDSFIAFNFNIFKIEKFTRSNLKGKIDFRIEDGVGISETLKNILKELHILTDFNFNQYVVQHTDIEKNLIVMASAGTGKTYSMISRVSFICYRNKYSHIDLRDVICMLTFTNEAAGNMRDKLKKHFLNYYILTKRKNYLLMLESVNEMNISTIHSYAYSMLRKYGSSIGIGKNVAIASGIFERRNILDETIDKCLAKILNENENALINIDISFYELKKRLLDMITKLYSKNIDISKQEDINFGNPISGDVILHKIIQDVILETEKEYLKQMNDENKIHLNQLIVRFNELSGNFSESNNLYKIEFLMIDEFQDTDDTQIRALIEMQKLMGFKLFVVGDIKQCIYRFRGATTSAFDYLVRCVGRENWTKISLNKNYRTNNNLLKSYNRACEKWAFKKTINRSSEEFGKIKLLTYDKERDRLVSKIYFKEIKEPFSRKVENGFESGKISSETASQIRKWSLDIENCLDKNPDLKPELKTIAILVRKNKQAYAIRNELEKFGIAVKVKTGGGLYQSKPAIDFYKMLNALIHHNEPEYLAAFIASGFVDANLNMDKLRRFESQEKVFYLTKLLDDYFCNNDALNGNSFTQIIRLLRYEPILKIIRIVIEICKPWQSAKISSNEIEEYRNNLNLIIEKVMSRFSTEFLTLNSLWQFMNISILTGVEEPMFESTDNNGVQVICLTVHKAKGLEFGYVVVPFTNLQIDDKSSLMPDISVDGNNIGYYIPLNKGSKKSSSKSANLIINSHFNTFNEINEKSMEETRLLYVAATRAIKAFSWITYREGETPQTWDSLLMKGL